MGCLGMGVTQSDEFCEVYDRFMESYNQGKCVADIRNEILGQYHAEFDDADGVMHDVYFALAKAVSSVFSVGFAHSARVKSGLANQFAKNP